MPRSTDGTFLPDDDFNRVQDLADRFAATRQKGSVDDWESYLPAAGETLRRAALLEFVKIDMEQTWKEESRVLVETYETLFPEITPPPVDLIVEEYRVRHRLGDKPGLEEYEVRYPHQFEEFERRAKERPPAQSAPKFQRPIAPPPEPVAAQPAVESLFPDGYRQLEAIGRGNFGEVWRAEAPGGIAVAVKIVSQPLDNEAAQRELKSLDLVKKLQHPALLSTLAVFIIKNRLVIIMELADCTLRDRMKECQAKGLPGIPSEELLSYFRDAAVGVDFLHWQGVLHRDIKPENILLKQGYAKVADFGLAREHIMGALASVSFAGTPAFMAPEMWAGKAANNSDQYSLAFTYAELRLGRRPLEGGDFVQVMTSALEGTPNLEGLSLAEQTVLRRALAKKPEDRYESCTDFVEALERAVSPDGRASRRRPTTQTPRLKPSETGASSTQQTNHGSDAPSFPTLQPDVKTKGKAKTKADGSGDRTFHQESTAQAPNVWKPAGKPKPTGGSPAKPILIVLVALALLGGAAGAAYLVFSGDGGKNKTSGSEPEVATSNEPRRTEPKPLVTLLVPDQFESVGDAGVSRNDKRYAERIVFRRDANDLATLKLMQPKDDDWFYIAENKATNALFQVYRTESPGGATAWKMGDPTWPALNVKWAEAQGLATWMVGDLPTPKQWDFAAGLSERASRPNGPANGPRVAVAVTNPLPVNRADTDDISPTGIRDLSGNGREWTRQKFPAAEELIELRGRMFTLSKALTYAQLDLERDPKFTQVQRPGVASPQTGFRVVVPLP